MRKAQPPTVVLRLGTRASALATVQSKHVARQLERIHRKRKLRVDLILISTRGDRDRRSPLKSFGSTGVFVKELERALKTRRVDFAVHSLKDLPLLQPKGLILAAVSKREDVRDVLVMRAGGRLAPGCVVGTGSPRRRSQLARSHPGLVFVELRGNVETRLRKVADGVCDATLLAHAGLKRLGWKVPARGLRLKLPGARSALQLRLIPLTRMLPSPGQGALGLECRTADRRTRKLLAVLNDPAVSMSTAAERSCLAGVGGGCDLPLGAFASAGRPAGQLRLQAVLALEDGRGQACATVRGPLSSAVRIGRRAAKLLCASPVGRTIRKH